MSAPVVIVGTGLAGYNLAREFRKLDGETPLLLITADDGRSYSKPMLSTGFGKNKDADGLSMAEPGAMAEQLKAEIRTHTRISGIDPGHKRLWIGEEAVSYRDLILAWGAETVRVPIEGDGGDLVFPINDLEDYARFRAAAAGKRRVLLLGAGLIGCEFANDLILGGYEVQLVAPCEQVMPTLLHPAAAAAVQAGLESLGARFHLGPVLTRLQKVADGLEAHLSDGQVVPCDVVVSAIGLRPRIDLAAAAGIQTNRGVVVDRHLQTSHANIYALGDCAEVDGLNLLYVMPLMSCARALAQTLAGNPTVVNYGPMPITVKTPVCPLVVSPPPRGREGVWTVEGQGADIKVLCHDAEGQLLGYALTGAAVMEKLALNKQLPALLA
ncbi:FAD-dependent oxidoreductase [Pseudomonas fluorescens]|uniref:Putative nitric oxide detoxification-related reductase n=1 Tax=Pseudomonas fluorescens (strain Pf0-1) TaxID=205922 RepID=Q3K4G6_PSEPF|nr:MULTISPECIES: FAD-dependent oxidoreductase [Pseudomonas]ABA77338.1 putative nitric oxide detoxification-related reductase [Pseudomonas fluorescens Pf0-1]MBX8624783.1 FAD-dependent oxidoreductase [Pseudomonas glycinae]MBY9022528.1 FAD-dependent oxidoreductase [Pseudomonas fluorescens]MBY9028520.1 FAD-dependent oxidoreductase [Pseudomonas fluorescens]MBY9033921.1 FAD-dependent oxidoreductase [Pseudomonas fluorescens]